jgi:hypothetical protein
MQTQLTILVNSLVTVGLYSALFSSDYQSDFTKMEEDLKNAFTARKDLDSMSGKLKTFDKANQLLTSEKEDLHRVSENNCMLFCTFCIDWWP